MKKHNDPATAQKSIRRPQCGSTNVRREFFARIDIGCVLVNALAFATFLEQPWHFPEGAGTVAIYSLWQGNTFRLELGPEAQESHEDVFSPVKVVRAVTPDEQPARNNDQTNQGNN